MRLRSFWGGGGVADGLGLICLVRNKPDRSQLRITPQTASITAKLLQLQEPIATSNHKRAAWALAVAVRLS